MKVIYILLDCVRYDYLGCNGNNEIYTPTIDELAAKGCSFHNHFSAAPWTSPSVASQLSGIYPHRLNMFTNHQAFPENVKSLFKYYSEKGFPAASFVKSKDFFGGDDHVCEIAYGWETPAILEWMQQNIEQDYFLYLHYWNTHLPYFTRYSKEGWYEGMYKLIEQLRQGRPEDIARAKSLYKSSVERASEEFVYAIVEKLDSQGILDDCLLVITSDHGESWGERFDDSGQLDLFGMHGKFLYDEIIHTPLILFGKGIARGSEVKSLTRSVDVFPTVLELMEWEVDKTDRWLDIDGRTLIPVISGQETDDRLCFSMTTYLDNMQENIISEVIEKYSCRDRNWKVIYDKRNNVFELYDLAADPHERENLATRKKVVLERFMKPLHDCFGELADGPGDYSADIISERLRNLGYI